MSATTSAATGRCFGIQRVCQVWERSRSALYARRARAHHRLGAGPARRGPPPRQSDAQLLAAIRTDLARSPFHGEGHRKVHARLRILDGIRVARTRVLRVMRAHGLLSPHRGRQGAAKTHDGRVITQAPNVMWGTDGVRVFTLDDGWGWIYRQTGTRSAWGGTCGRKPLRGKPRARTALWLAGRQLRMDPGVSTCQTTSSSRSGIGGSTPASALSRNHERGAVERTLAVPALSNDFQAIKVLQAAKFALPEPILRFFDLVAFGEQAGLLTGSDYDNIRRILADGQEHIPRAFRHNSFANGVQSFAPRLCVGQAATTNVSTANPGHGYKRKLLIARTT